MVDTKARLMKVNRAFFSDVYFPRKNFPVQASNTIATGFFLVYISKNKVVFGAVLGIIHESFINFLSRFEEERTMRIGVH